MSHLNAFAQTFRNFRAANRSRRKLPFPAVQSQRIAQISATSKPFDSAQQFARSEWSTLKTFKPQILVGTTSDLLRLSRMAELDRFDWESVDQAIFVLTPCGHNPLNDVDRVSLWQAFGVPLFELFVSSRGRLLASECEAHEGWHIEPGVHFSLVDQKLIVDEPVQKAIPTGLTGTLDNSLCPCGRAGARVLEIDGHAAWTVQQELKLAATA